MKRERQPLHSFNTDTQCIKLLIDMTNQFIDYRNQIFDSTQVDAKVVEKEDVEYIEDMDKKIDEVIAYLDD